MDGSAFAAQRPGVNFESFASLDFRVAEVIEAKMAAGTRSPCRILKLDIGPLGHKQSVGQFALVAEEYLLGQRVIVCTNLLPRDGKMTKVGPHPSDVLVLGTPHPDSPAGQNQATPLLAGPNALPGQQVF